MNIAPLISVDRVIDLIKDLWEDFKPIIFLNDYEKGVIMRAGKLHRVMRKGINLRIPFVEMQLSTICTIDTMPTRAVHVTTTDDKTITAVPVIEYTIDDIVKFMIETNDARSNIHDITRAEVSDYLTDCTWTECKLKKTIDAITRKVAKQCKTMGVDITRVMLTDMCVSKVIITQI